MIQIDVNTADKSHASIAKPTNWPWVSQLPAEVVNTLPCGHAYTKNRVRPQPFAMADKAKWLHDRFRAEADLRGLSATIEDMRVRRELEAMLGAGYSDAEVGARARLLVGALDALQRQTADYAAGAAWAGPDDPRGQY